MPLALKRGCDGPADLPERALTSAETARFWARDRQALGDCRARHGALALATEALETQGR